MDLFRFWMNVFSWRRVIPGVHRFSCLPFHQPIHMTHHPCRLHRTYPIHLGLFSYCTTNRSNIVRSPSANLTIPMSYRNRSSIEHSSLSYVTREMTSLPPGLGISSALSRRRLDSLCSLHCHSKTFVPNNSFSRAKRIFRC